MEILKKPFLLIFIVLSIALVFSPVFKAGFTNYDDDVLVTENNLIKSFDAANLKKILFSSYCGLYHPLVLLSYCAEYKISGLNPRIYHVTNLVLHIANSLLVMWMLTAAGAGITAAFIVAMLFGLHPLHVESVAWIAERKDVLYAFFFLLSCIAYLYYKSEKKTRLYAVSIIMFLFSLMSKPMAVSLPLVLLLFDFYKTGHINKEDIKEKIPYFTLAALFSVVTLMSHYTSPDSPGGPQFNILGGLREAVNGIVFYASKLFYPARLSPFYPYSGHNWSEYFHIPAVPYLIFTAMALAVVISLRHSKIVSFGTLFFAAALLPVLQILPFGQKIPADRFTYIPSIGIFYILAEGYVRLTKNRSSAVRVLMLLLAGLSAAGLSFMTYERCKAWNNSFTLWNDTINKYPDLPQAYKNRADAFKTVGKMNEALADYQHAISLKNMYPQAFNNRGNLYSSLGNYSEAIEDYSSAIKQNPGYVSAIYNRALAFADLNKFPEAAADYSLAIEKKPDYYEGFNNRGIIRAKSGAWKEAIDDFSKAASINPQFNDAYANRAFAFCSAGNLEKCMEDVSLLLSRKYKVNPALLKLLMDKGLIK